MMLVLRGFKYSRAKEYIKDSKTLSPKNRKLYRHLCNVLPLDTHVDKLFSDVLTSRFVLRQFADYFPRYYGICVERGNEKELWPLMSSSSKERIVKLQDIAEELKWKGSFFIRPSNVCPFEKTKQVVYRNSEILLNGNNITNKELERIVLKTGNDCIFMECPSSSTGLSQLYSCETVLLRTVFIADDGGKKDLADTLLCGYDFSQGKITEKIIQKTVKEAKEENKVVSDALILAEKISDYFLEAEYMDVWILLGEKKPYIWQIKTDIDADYFTKCPQKIRTFFEKRYLSMRKETFGGMLNTIGKYLFSFVAAKKGFVDYMYKNWLRGLKEDNKIQFTTIREKMWAHRRGFYSYRIPQYGLTEENYRDYMSDYDYKWLRPINHKYHKWLWDKITMYYVLSPFSSYLPRYFFRIKKTSRGKLIIPFDTDNTNGSCEYSGKDIVEKLIEEGMLVAKPAIGSHGKGFYKLTFDKIKRVFCVNDIEKDYHQVVALIDSLDSDYLISEYVEMNEQLKRIYDKVACTVRIMTVNSDEVEPGIIKYAYFRIGSRSTGHTDNLDTGGLVAKVDIDTGRFGQAELLINHGYTPCPIHPDTGVEITGTLPYWESIKEKISDIANYLRPLEYLGFDIVITDEGFKILEINTHQDLHKYMDYPDDVKKYLSKKLSEKKKRYYGKRKS